MSQRNQQTNTTISHRKIQNCFHRKHRKNEYCSCKRLSQNLRRTASQKINHRYNNKSRTTFGNYTLESISHQIQRITKQRDAFVDTRTSVIPKQRNTTIGNQYGNGKTMSSTTHPRITRRRQNIGNHTYYTYHTSYQRQQQNSIF